MFTVKATFEGGHRVLECVSYRIRRPGVNVGPDTIADREFATLDIFNADGNLESSFIVRDTVYVMNSAGKTVDTFHGPPKGTPAP